MARLREGAPSRRTWQQQPHFAAVGLLLLCSMLLCRFEQGSGSAMSFGHCARDCIERSERDMFGDPENADCSPRKGVDSGVLLSRVTVLRLRGGRKGISAKHTTKEEAAKTQLATKNMGGGKAGLADRAGGKGGHAKFLCPLPGCNMQAPSLKNMEMHHDSKHAKVPWDPSIYIDAQAMHGGSTQVTNIHAHIYGADACAVACVCVVLCTCVHVFCLQLNYSPENIYI